MDGVGGTCSFWGKTEERISKNNFLKYISKETATKGDLCVVSHCSAVDTHALMGQVANVE